MNELELNGIKTYCFSDRTELIDFALENKKSLIALNAEKILNSSDQVRKLISRNVGFCDGIGAVWAMKTKGYKDAVKIPGCELWLDVIRKSYSKKTYYFIGSEPEVIRNTVQKLTKEFPGIRILNYRDGYINDESEKHEILKDLNSKKPDIVFVAMGSPKQELFIDEMLNVHPAVYQGLGGSFDVYTGRVSRAPKWWIDNNLEWAYRLIKQPVRIRRQFSLLKFLYLLLIRKI